MKKIVRLIVSLICIFLSFTINIQAAIDQPEYESRDFTFLVNSDIHQTEIESRRDAQKESMLNDIANVEYNTSAVLFAGDLTDVGSNTQFESFVRAWITPITSLMPTKPHGGLYLCNGNHDEYSGNKAHVLNYIKEEYGNFCYSFDIQGLHFACCGKYPQSSTFGGILKWLKSDLKKLAPETPIVIFFHYNILGPYSDWWSVSCGSCICTSAKNEKNYFFDAIKNYNIQGIFFGHWHNSYSALWRNKVRIVCVGGDQYALCQYTPATKSLEIMFKDGSGRVYSWDNPILLHNDLEEL